SLRVPVGRSGRAGADPHRRVRGRRPPGRASSLLRPAGRHHQRSAARRDLKAVPPLPDTPDLLLAGGDVLLHDGKWRVERADVTVRDGRIVQVGKGNGETGKGKGPHPHAQIRDCRGCLIMPGLIQAHVHLCRTLLRGLADDVRLEDWLVRRIWPLEAAHTEETVYWSALLGAAELLLGGSTAILDMETGRHTGAAFQALEGIGIRATVGKCLMDAHPEGAPLELAESTDNALAEAEALAKRWHNGAGSRLRVCFAPRFVPSCSGPLLRAASELAERFDAQLHTHAAETIVERETVLRTTGLEEIAYLDSVGGARALGLETEIGSIAPGKRADLVVLDLREPHLHPAGGDPVSLVVYAACASDVRDVFVDGRPVVLGHELLTAPIEEIVREADRAAAELHDAAQLA